MGGVAGDYREHTRLNEVRPRRPEQSVSVDSSCSAELVSMKSGLEGRNNERFFSPARLKLLVSMKSGLEGRNNSAISGRV